MSSATIEFGVDEEGAEDQAIDELQQTLNKEGAEEVTSFFKSVAAVTRAEQQLIAEHRETLEVSEAITAQEKELLAEVHDTEGGCSIDEYANALEKVLAEKMGLCLRVQAKLDALKRQLADEEALSARVKKVPVY